MASAKRDNGPASAPAASTPFDYSKYLPEGVKKDDFQLWESLTPIYNPEIAMAEAWEPAVGFAYGTELLPAIMAGTKDEYIPMMIRVSLTHPTKAQAGTKDARKTVELKAGDDILIPVNANLKQNKRLENALIDGQNVAELIFRVAGTMSTGRPSDMWVWEVGPTTRKLPRTGKYAFPSAEVLMLDGSVRQIVPGGHLVNKDTGEVRSPAQASS